MNDNTPIIVGGIVTLVAGIVIAFVTAWATSHYAERTRLNDTEVLIAKYRDPLVCAAYELQSRLYSIVTGRFPLSWKGDADRRKQDHLVIYTPFLVGQYLSWTYIFRRQAQFLHIRTKKDIKLTKTMDLIEFLFSSTKNTKGSPFCLWGADQKAIGELMTDKGEG
ncbi:hypothetical protein BGZ81_004017, partial [Podila clonocystis]